MSQVAFPPGPVTIGQLGREIVGDRLGLADAVDNPAEAAKKHPVFELKPGAPGA